MFRSWWLVRILLLLLLSTAAVSEGFVLRQSSKIWRASSSPVSRRAATASTPSEIRFLGKGSNALVRPGVVLIAPSNEFHHFYRQSAIFIYAMGLDERNQEVIRGVILDHPTPFTMEEMAGLEGRLGGNLLYRGGSSGTESAMMLQCVGGNEEIGTSGVFEGGLAKASERDDSLDNYKFFFNYCEFSPKELENMLDEIDPETGDAWMSVEVPPRYVLEDWDRGECWRHLRNILRQRFKNERSTERGEHDPYDT